MNKSTCAIIGVGPGLGISLVEQFTKNGFSVAMMARNSDKLAGYKAGFDGKGYETAAFPVDISNDERLRQSLDSVVKTYGSLDVLIFNASVLNEGNPSDIDPSLLFIDMNINFKAAIVAAQAVLPHMKKQNAGTILFTGSGAALNPIPSIISLSASKAALRYYALALGEELKDTALYAATITIKGTMEKSTRFDPDLIAEKFWWMYQTKPLQREFVYQ